jgi:hypothetical protein
MCGLRQLNMSQSSAFKRLIYRRLSMLRRYWQIRRGWSDKRLLSRKRDEMWSHLGWKRNLVGLWSLRLYLQPFDQWVCIAYDWRLTFDLMPCSKRIVQIAIQQKAVL